MATPTTNRGLVKQAHNENVDSWDTPLNGNFDILDKNLGGLLTVPVSNVNVTLSAAQAQNLMFSVTGVLSGNVSLIYPAVGGFFVVINSTSGAFTLTVTNPTGATVVVPQGQSALIFSTGTGVFAANPQVAPNMLTTGGPSWDSSGNLTTGNTLTATGSNPQVKLVDNSGAGALTRTVYCDGGLVGFLTSANTWAMYVDDSGNLTAAGNVAAYSDERLKDNVVAIGRDKAASIVQALEGYFYDRLSTGKREVGLIAQKLEAYLPEAVATDADGMKSIYYSNLVALLIEALNHAFDRIKALESK